MSPRIPAITALTMAGLAAITLALPPPAGAGTGGPERKAPQAQRRAPGARPTTTPIKHFVFLMQGGRTFDNYFGSYPGAEGPPAGACQYKMTDRPADGCVKPFLLTGEQAPALNTSGTVISGSMTRAR